MGVQCGLKIERRQQALADNVLANAQANSVGPETS